MTTSSYHLDTPAELWEEFGGVVSKQETYNDRLVRLIGEHVLEEGDLDEERRAEITALLEGYQ
jgi:hypothetical protein